MCGCAAYLQAEITPNGKSCHGAKEKMCYTAKICAVDAQLLRMNFKNIAPYERAPLKDGSLLYYVGEIGKHLTDPLDLH